jgi:hypothetical protein
VCLEMRISEALGAKSGPERRHSGLGDFYAKLLQHYLHYIWLRRKPRGAYSAGRRKKPVRPPAHWLRPQAQQLQPLLLHRPTRPISSVNFLDATYQLIQVLVRWVNEENPVERLAILGFRTFQPNAHLQSDVLDNAHMICGDWRAGT